VTLRLDVSDCQIDSVISGSYSGAGLLIADLTADAGSALVHGNRIRSRFPMGETALLAGVGEAAVTGNVVANEVAPQVPFGGGSPPAVLPSYSLVLNPGTTPLSAVITPSGTLFGDVAGVPAVAVTGNVFVDPPNLPPRPGLPAPLDDWRTFNTVISYGLPAPPAVTGISPVAGPAGTQVTVTGSGFTGATAVSVGGAAAPFTLSSDTQLTVTIPGGSGTAAVTVTTPGGTSQAVTQAQFSYLAVTGVSPASGQPPLSVTVFGTGFTGATAVTFGSNAGGGLLVAPGGNQLTATLPPGSGTVDVKVSTPAGTSQANPADQFTYLALTSVNPTLSYGFTPQLLVRGAGFVAGSTTVVFTGLAGTGLPTLTATAVNVTDGGTLVATFPGGNLTPVGTYVLTVRTPYGTSPPGSVTYQYQGSSHS
jgi:hypothetical protein